MNTKLSVNINKVATLRNARGGKTPDLVQIAKDCELFGAEGITIHPRPDERHITRQDAYDLAEVVTTEFNIEGYPNERFMELLRTIKPTQATLVPDPPHVLTSNAGWDTIKQASFLKDTLAEIKAMGIRTAIFMGTEPELIVAAAETGTERIELYTGPYADQFETDKEAAILPFIAAAKLGVKHNMQINAGHDLSLSNLSYFKQHIPELMEVSIGHALISDALYLGLENTIKMYQHRLNG